MAPSYLLDADIRDHEGRATASSEPGSLRRFVTYAAAPLSNVPRESGLSFPLPLVRQRPAQFTSLRAD
jgi:hypothetical protein